MKVYLEVKPILSEKKLGPTASGGRKLRSIIFILIESGMALFAIQLARLLLSVIAGVKNSSTAAAIIQPIITIQEMLNVIIGPVIFTTYLTDSLCLGRA